MTIAIRKLLWRFSMCPGNSISFNTQNNHIRQLLLGNSLYSPWNWNIEKLNNLCQATQQELESEKKMPKEERGEESWRKVIDSDAVSVWFVRGWEQPVGSRTLAQRWWWISEQTGHMPTSKATRIPWNAMCWMAQISQSFPLEPEMGWRDPE